MHSGFFVRPEEMASHGQQLFHQQPRWASLSNGSSGSKDTAKVSWGVACKVVGISKVRGAGMIGASCNVSFTWHFWGFVPRAAGASWGGCLICVAGLGLCEGL